MDAGNIFLLMPSGGQGSNCFLDYFIHLPMMLYAIMFKLSDAIDIKTCFVCIANDFPTQMQKLK